MLITTTPRLPHGLAGGEFRPFLPIRLPELPVAPHRRQPCNHCGGIAPLGRSWCDDDCLQADIGAQQ